MKIEIIETRDNWVVTITKDGASLHGHISSLDKLQGMVDTFHDCKNGKIPSPNYVINNTEPSDEENKAWLELWSYANDSISIHNIGIDLRDFIDDGKLLFDVRLKDKQ